MLPVYFLWKGCFSAEPSAAQTPSPYHPGPGAADRGLWPLAYAAASAHAHAPARGGHYYPHWNVPSPRFHVNAYAKPHGERETWNAYGPLP